MAFRVEVTNRPQVLISNEVRGVQTSGQKLLSTLTFALAALIFTLISLGGLVRNEGAGLSCPDWPLCYGQVVPPMSYQVFLEWFHRLIAGSVSCSLLAISTYVGLRSDLRFRLGKYCALAMTLLAAQVILGGLTVLGLLSPKWVSSHLVVGLLFFGTIVLLHLEVRDLDLIRIRDSRLKGLSKLAALAAVTVLGQIVLGGLVSSNYAGLACPDFPKCFGMWVPPMEGIIRFQIAHRIGAVLASGAVGFFIFSAWNRTVSSRFSFSVKVALVFTCVQVALGIAAVLLRLPLLISVAHLATAAALFATLLVVNYELRRS